MKSKHGEIPLAVIEAKDLTQSVGAGMQQAIKDGVQHVSVKPSNDYSGSLLNQWIATRGLSTPHKFTLALSAVCMEYRANG